MVRVLVILLLLIYGCGDPKGNYHPPEKSGGIDQPCNSWGTPCDPALYCDEGYCRSFPENSFTIATYNVYDCAINDAYKLIAGFIATYGVDLIIFQEIQPEDEAPLVAALAAEGVEMPYRAFSTVGGHLDDHIAVFSKDEIVDHETIIPEYSLDPSTGERYIMESSRPIFRADVKQNGSLIHIYGLHLKAQYPYEGCPECIGKRRAQSYDLERYLKTHQQLSGEDVIIAGDLNTALGEDFMPDQTIDIITMKRQGLTEGFIPVNLTLLPRESTHHRYNSRLDHLILSPGLYQRYIEHSVAVPEQFGSDHKPVLLRLKNRE